MRVVEKSWTEMLGNSKITHTTTVCPDAKCQKIVEEQLNKKKAHLASIQEESQKRRENIRRARSKKHPKITK